MNALRGILVWVLVAVGAATTAYPALAYAGGALRQARLTAEVATLLGPADRPFPAPAGGSAAPAGPAALPGDTRPGREGEPLGVLEIPSIGLRATFLEGVSGDVLLVGPGHIPGTAPPGTDGVSVLAAHRDTHFRRLRDVVPGDRVFLRLPSGPRHYRVTGRDVVGPAAGWVTAPRDRSILRLVTCWPPWFIGPAPERLVVTALPVAKIVEAPRDGEPTSPAAADPPPPVERPRARQPLPISSLPFLGAAGIGLAACGAMGAWRSRRRLAWWFLPWMFGVGVAMLALLAAWSGPLPLLGG